MKQINIDKLCCPFDKSDLTLNSITKTAEGNVLEGFFTCRQCKRIYPIVSGIPIMSPDEYREPSLEKPLLDQWQKHLQGQAVENFRLIEKES